MKYLNTFESYDNQLKFKVGDYIKLNIESKWNLYEIVRVMNIDDIDSKYILELITFQNDIYKLIKNKPLNFHSDLIERIATTEEIEEYEAIKNSIKYNL